MKYDNLKAFEKHLESASPDHFSGVYLILSKDAYDGKEASQILLNHLLPKERDLSLCTLDGAHASAEDILTELNSLSFFVQKKAVWVQQADKIRKPVQEALEPYIVNFHRSVYLIFTASSLLKTTSFYKKIEKAGIVLELPELKPWEKERRLIEWVSKQAAAARIIMPHPVCQLLVKSIGTDHSLLEKEFEKLLCYIGEKKEITQKDVEAICTHFDTQTVWQLGEAIFRFDAAAALPICRQLLSQGQGLLPFLRQIRSQFETGLQISSILSREDGQISEISQNFPYMKGQILDKNVQQAKNYGLERYKRGLLAIDEAEFQSKNVQIDDELLAELLLIKLTTRNVYG